MSVILGPQQKLVSSVLTGCKIICALQNCAFPGMKMVGLDRTQACILHRMTMTKKMTIAKWLAMTGLEPALHTTGIKPVIIKSEV